jgi:hypothetical protein
MTTPDPGQDIAHIYEKYFRHHAHMLIVWGHQRAVASIQPDSDEPDISGFLAEAIRNLLATGSCRWFQHYTVHNEKPISAGNRTGKSRKKLDLTIEYVARQERPEYVFEAKPLNSTKSHQRTKNYLDKEGVQRFLWGEYAEYTARYPEVGMLGYVLTETPARWHEQLKKAIDAHAELLQLNAPQFAVNIVDELPFEWGSEHKRTSADTHITIYHILLDCSS